MTQTTEDYLKTIYLLQKNRGEARNALISETLGVSKPTVTNIVKRLAREKYVTVNGDYSIRLTDTGRKIAESTLDRNRTIRELLMGLGVDEETAESDACEMEHAISPKSLDALKILAKRQCLKTCIAVQDD